MKYTILLLALLCTALHTRAQRVTNVTAEQQGQELLIHYHLEADGPVEVLLYLSTDRGSRWEGPLKSCSGDVGPNVAPGSGKRIRWEVLKDRELVGDGIAFKVVAEEEDDFVFAERFAAVQAALRGHLKAKGGIKKDWLNPALTYGSVTDIDGNTYATIQIGTQVWMAENLRTTRYRNGDPIPNVTEAGKWTGLSSGAWCHYKNDPKYEVPYGKLYNWYTVNDPRKVCPAGWHVPTESDWSALINYLDPANGNNGYYSETAGGKMISTGTQYGYSSKKNGATNESGFSGLPGGGRYYGGNFIYLGNLGSWWSASESGAEGAWYRELNLYNAAIDRTNAHKRVGFSVRCLRD